MQTLAAIARSLNTKAADLAGVLERFAIAVPRTEIPVPCAAFLRTVTHLRILGISEESILKLWNTEKKLVQHLHLADSASPTWQIDACGKATHPERRLFLTNIDTGFPLTAQSVQPGLNFDAATPELFEGAAMGEDARKLISAYLTRRDDIIEKIAAALPHLREALRWGGTLAQKASPTRRPAAPV